MQVDASAHPLRVFFCAWYVAGVRTQYENVRGAAETDGAIAMRYIEVNPYKPGGFIERFPLLGNRTKGSLRSLACTLPLYTSPEIDAVWTQADTALFPFSATRARWRGIPYVISTDATTAQVESMPEYGFSQMPATTRAKHWVRDRMAAYVYRHAAAIFPWSNWAASAIQRQYGIPDERIHVIPPGVNLDAWRLRQAGWATGAGNTRPARLLFVGGDFVRKGGPLLVKAFRERLRDRCELHLVTRDAPADVATQGIVVHADLQPNDDRLRHLYETCDVMVLPTRADCFSLASIEAMAAGMPVITTRVGGIPEIVADGESGFLVGPGNAAGLLTAIQCLLADPALMERMGQRGRQLAAEHFDATKNTQRAFHLLRAIRSGA